MSRNISCMKVQGDQVILRKLLQNQRADLIGLVQQRHSKQHCEKKPLFPLPEKNIPFKFRNFLNFFALYTDGSFLV